MKSTNINVRKNRKGEKNNAIDRTASRHREILYDEQLSGKTYRTGNKEKDNHFQRLALVKTIAERITKEDIEWAKKQLAKVPFPKPKQGKLSLFEAPQPLPKRTNKQQILIAIIQSSSFTEKESKKAREELFVSNHQFIVSIARRIGNDSALLPIEDLIQASSQGFIEGMDNFDIRQIFTAGLRSYAVWWCAKRIRQEITVSLKRVDGTDLMQTYKHKMIKHKDNFYQKNYYQPSAEELYDFIIEENYQTFIKTEKLENHTELEFIQFLKVHPLTKRYFAKNKQKQMTDFEEIIELVFSPPLPRDKFPFMLNSSVEQIEQPVGDDNLTLSDVLEDTNSTRPDENSDSELFGEDMMTFYKILKRNNLFNDLERSIFERRLGIEEFEYLTVKKVDNTVLTEFINLNQLGNRFTVDNVNAIYNNVVNTIREKWQKYSKTSIPLNI